MQDGQFSRQLFQPNPTPEYKPIYFEPTFYPFRPNAAGAAGINDNPDLYDDISIANQSGFKNWINTFLHGLNETQIGIGAADLMDGLVKKAQIDKEISQLDAEYATGNVNQATYLSRKNKLLDKLQGAYDTITDARESMYEDRQDQARRPISKAYQFRTQLTMLQGSGASLMDQMKYSFPEIAGSSAATLGATLASGFLGKVIKNMALRGIQGSAIGGGVPGAALGVLSGLATVFSINAAARHWESKAEVGSQFLADYEMLREKYLDSKPAGYELTDDEENQLVLQAAQGSDTQYWKNMSLALSDSLQSMIFAGAVGKTFRGLTNVNKFTRLAGLGAEWYVSKKLEGLEEGLQYAFQTDKTLESLGFKDPESFGKSLFRNYGDVISSMSIFGLSGDGAFSNDPEFQANVNAGELLGGIFGGVSVMSRMIRDINSYYQTNKELADLNPTKVEAPFLKFKDELYSRFFGPKQRGVLGLFSEDAEDRVFFFKEGLKTLNKKRLEDGSKLLSDEELAQELKDIDTAFETFQEINSSLDAILTPFGKANRAIGIAAKREFRKELFHNTMTLNRYRAQATQQEAGLINTFNSQGLNTISQLTARLGVVKDRIKNAQGNVAEYLTKEEKRLEDAIKTEKETNKILDSSSAVTTVDQATYKKINDLYDTTETVYDYEKKRKGLTKVKDWKSLLKWTEEYEKTAPESYLKQQEEDILDDNEEFAKGIIDKRQPLNTLNEEERKERKKQNLDILDRAGYSSNYAKTLSEEDLDREAQRALEDFKERVANITEDTMLGLILNSNTKDELISYLNRPAVRAMFNTLGYDINESFEDIKEKADNRWKEIFNERRKNKLRRSRPQGLQNPDKDLIVSRTKHTNDTRETDEYIDAFNIRDGKASQKDVLTAIINSPFATDSERELARKLLAITEDEEVEFKENWRPKTKGNVVSFDSNGNPINPDDAVRKPGTTEIRGDEIKVIIDLGHFGDEFEGNQAENQAPAIEAIILHELVHRYTVKALQADPALMAEVTTLLQSARANTTKNYYGLTNEMEFLAEAMSSPEFQTYLASVEGTGKKTLWQQFIDAVASLLKRAFNLEIEGSLLEDVIAVTSGIISDSKKTKVNVVAIVEGLMNEIAKTLSEINISAKTALQDLESAFGRLQTKIIETVNNNNIADTVKSQLLEALTTQALDVENKINEYRDTAKQIHFQGRTFERGSWVALTGYAEPYWISRADATGLKVRNAENNVEMTITDVARIEFNGQRAEAQYFLDQRDKPAQPQYLHNNSPHLYKSIGQQFDKVDGKFVEDSQPVTKRFYRFLNFLHGQDLAKTPYRGLIIQDDDAVAGFPIPRDPDTQKYLAEGGKRGQIVVIVDRNGNPVKFDENFNESPTGEYVVFNIETAARIMDRDTKALADHYSITLKQAETLKSKAATAVGKARKSASEGKPVFIDFKMVAVGVDVNYAIRELEMTPITSEDANRVLRLHAHFQSLTKEQKEKRQQVKDFLFNFIMGITPNSSINGGVIKINGEVVTNPTVEQIINNFGYKPVFNFVKANAPYTLLDIQNGKVIIDNAFPSYTEYLMTVSNLNSKIEESRYNSFVVYEIAEVKSESTRSDIETKLPPKDTFEGDLFDVSFDVDLEGELNAEKKNFSDGFLGNLYKNIEITGDVLQQMISQALDDQVKSEAAFGKRATEILYELATYQQVENALNNKRKLQDSVDESDDVKPMDDSEFDYLYSLLDSKSQAFDTSLENPFTNELGLFNNQTTYELVRSIDRGLHSYLRKVKTTTIERAMDDRDFLTKALTETQRNLLIVLNKLKEKRAEQLASSVINQAYYEAQLATIDDKINKITNNWDKIVNYYFQNSYVFSFAKDLAYQYDESGNLIQSGDDRVAREKGFDKIGNEISPIDGASKEIKALIRGLGRWKKVNNTWMRPANSFNVPELVNFAPTWNNLLKNMQGLSTFNEMLEKLRGLTSRFKEYEELLDILEEYYKKAVEGDEASISMITKFYRSFSEPEIPIIENLIEITSTTTTFKVDEATRKNIKDLRKAALDNFRFKSPFAANTTLKDKALSPRILQLPIDTRADRVKFLEALGFEFSEGTLNDPLFDTVASTQILRFFKEEILAFNDAGILIKDPLTQLARGASRGTGVARRINDIIALESKYTETAPTLSMQNADGNTEYAISRPNFYTVVLKAINNSKKYPTFQALVAEPAFAFLNFPNARTSHVLNTIFVLDSETNYGARRTFNKKPITLKLVNNSGLNVENGEGHKTTSLFIGDKLVSDFNQFLKRGFKENMRAGDKNSAFGLWVSSFPQPNGMGILPISNFDLFKGRNGYGGKQLVDIMEKYLHGEIMRIYLGRRGYLDNVRKMNERKTEFAKNASLFQGLLTAEQRKELYKDIDALEDLEPNSKEFYDKTQVLAKDFITRPGTMLSIKMFFYHEYQAKKQALAKYGFTFEDRFWLDANFDQYTSDTLLKAYIVNEFILNVEQTKLFTGDIVFYSVKDGEFHKRNPAFGATGVIPMTDQWLVDAINRNPNTNLQAKRLGLNHQYSNIVKTTVFREQTPPSVYMDAWTKYLREQGLSEAEIKRIVEPYKANKEADAQGWITLDYYRIFKITIGAWGPEQGKIYSKVVEGIALSTDEVEAFHRLFPPIKAQYAGPLAHEYYHVPAFHKFSLMPLIPAAIKGTALEVLNERMIRNNVGYALMESGSKVGTIGTNLEPFYADIETRTMKEASTPFDNINLIHAQFLKEQVQIEPELHTEVIFGTQFRKLLFQNIYSEGQPLNRKLATLDKEYGDIIEEITNYEKEILLQDMGVEAVKTNDEVTDYIIRDQSKLINRVREEVKRRKLNNAVKEFFELENGKLKYPLDATINHQQVRTLILSMINNRLIRQTIKGDMLIQGASTGYEKLTKPTDADLLKYGTNGLRFYYVDGGKVRKMQVKTSLTGDFKHLLNYTWNGAKISTLERLNMALKDPEWVEANNKSITMIGYRIPTQGLNSIEAMEIAEFLPPEAGPILIVPTEIVTKAGSDFDIDKLSVFKPSLYTRNGVGQYIERTAYTGTKKAILESFQTQFEELKAKRKAYKLFSSLNMTEKEEFISALKSRLQIEDKDLVQKIADTGKRIQELKQTIADVQIQIEDLVNELRASFDPDKNEILVGQKAALMDVEIELAIERDKIAEFKKNLLLQRFQEPELENAEDLLDAIYDELFGETTGYNEAINRQIRELVQERRELMDAVANYKFGLFNRLIEIAAERITDVDSFAELITPNAVDLLKPQINEIATKIGANKKAYKHTSNLASSTQEEKFLAGIPNKQALGIAAVANTMSQLFNKVNLKVNQSFRKREVFHPMIDILTMGSKFLKDGILKSEIESQMINAYVDVLNDDFVSRANLSLDTAGVFFYLLHLGHSKDQLLYFFNHPVIRAYVAELQKSKSIIRYQNALLRELTAKRQNMEDVPLGDIVSIIKGRAKYDAFVNVVNPDKFKKLSGLRSDGIAYAKSHKSIFSLDSLQKDVSKSLDEIPRDTRQAILSYYLSVVEESSSLLDLQRANNYDTTTSVNPIANEFREYLKQKILEDGLFSTADVVSKTVIKPFNQTGLIASVLETLMPVSLNTPLRAKIVDILSEMDSDVDADKITRVFINDWIYYLAVNYGETASGANLGQYGKALLIKDSVVDDRLADQLIEFKVSDKWANLRSDFPIIDLLRVDTLAPKTTTGGRHISNISLYREDNSTDYQNMLIEQFQRLAEFNEIGYEESEKATIKKFFRDLFVLGFVQSGLNKSPISFTDVIPNQYYAPMMTKALEKYQALTPQEKNIAFYKFVSKFRGNNTNLFGNTANDIPYWRFKDYVDPTTPAKNYAMAYKMPAAENIWGVDTTTLAEAESGRRIATTRSFALGKVGDIITFEGRPQRYVITEVEILTQEKVNDPAWIQKWSEKEGWTVEHFKKVLGGGTVHVGSYQTTFKRADEHAAVPSTTQITPINISTKSDDPLGRALTNPTWGSKRDGKNYFDVETEYKASKSKNPKLEEALREDMNTMYLLINKKLRQNPELIDQINERGGLSFIQSSSHIIGVKNSRWEGNGMNSNFIKVLAKSYETVSKELGKFVSTPIAISKVERFNGIITRDIVKANPNTLYLFGDNDIRRGLGGQAKEMRGEPNTVGISTKKLPNNNPEAFKTDSEYEINIKIIKQDIDNAIVAWKSGKYTKVVIPQIGVGLAKLPENAPKTFEFLQNEFNRFEAFVNSTNPQVTPMLQYTNHSGGAAGGDTYWDIIGREYGFVNHRHYREPGQRIVDSTDLRNSGVIAVPIDEADFKEGEQKAKEAAKAMGRRISAAGAKYQYRNWAQVKYADAIFAVSRILRKGDKDKRGYEASIMQVEGGTGYAVQMALAEGKPVYVFDQNRQAWYQARYTEDLFGKKTFSGYTKVDTPVLTLNYAGIGTRELTEVGKQAIRDVYEKTKNNQQSFDISLESEKKVVSLSTGKFRALLDNLQIYGIIERACK